MRLMLQKTVIPFLSLIILCMGCLRVSSMDEMWAEGYPPLNPILRDISQEGREPKEEAFHEPSLNVVVVIDVFRAFTTACYILGNNPNSYILTNKSKVISQLASGIQAPLLIGKPEIGAILHYHIPNSPTRVQEINITGQNVLHRTEAGAKGVLNAKGADLILAAGLVNAEATVQYIKKLRNAQVRIAPMGHEGTTPSLEDDICAHYIKARLQGQTLNLEQYHAALQKGSGSYFFSGDQWQYPYEDFKCCLELNRFNYAVKAEVQGDYAILTRLEE